MRNHRGRPASEDMRWFDALPSRSSHSRAGSEAVLSGRCGGGLYKAIPPSLGDRAGLQRTSGHDMLARPRPARYLFLRPHQPRTQIYSISPPALFHSPTAVHSLLPAASSL